MAQKVLGKVQARIGEPVCSRKSLRIRKDPITPFARPYAGEVPERRPERLGLLHRPAMQAREVGRSVQPIAICTELHKRGKRLGADAFC